MTARIGTTDGATADGATADVNHEATTHAQAFQGNPLERTPTNVR
ncbi:hypothetical protein FBY33_1355 [Arthrobacter sp. SLBN-112]|nr:hypothetical protein [Arthrobacter sp. SLBN-112]TQJ39340.1 hypothetical protein FBY33_1355 [Arthrobacter sp. SLBN-112]